ncbi:TetR/AcrR family transcriptional regulator [Lacticaseibacillus suihuaensis]
MGTHHDLRVMKTERALTEAFYALLETQSFDSITVLALSARAEVGQTTFYHHYQDKYALAEAVINTVLDQLAELILTRFEHGELLDLLLERPAEYQALIAKAEQLKTIQAPEISFRQTALRKVATGIQHELTLRHVQLGDADVAAKYLALPIYQALQQLAVQPTPPDARVLRRQVNAFVLATTELLTPANQLPCAKHQHLG